MLGEALAPQAKFSLHFFVWCKRALKIHASQSDCLFVFTLLMGTAIARACAPALADLIHEANTRQMALPFYEVDTEQRAAELDEFIASDDLSALPSRYRKAVEQAVALFHFIEGKESASLSPAFNPLLSPLDDAALRACV